MTPQEKAEELIEKFTMDNTRQGERNGMKCALKFVNEILESFLISIPEHQIVYWTEVKKEIENYEKAN